MDAIELEFQLLLSEKVHADKQIASYSELQLKLLAFLFGAGSAGLGFFLSKGADTLEPPELAAALVVLAIAGCVVMLQSVVTYGIALGYIHYKKVVLAPRIAKLGGLTEAPNLSVTAFRTSPARFPVFLASAVLVLLHGAGTVAVLVWAQALSGSASTAALIVPCWVLLVLTFGTEISLAIAIAVVGRGEMQATRPDRPPNQKDLAKSRER